MARRLSLPRALGFSALALVLALAMLEGCAGLLLRVIELPSEDAQPEWLVSQREAFRRGTYIPDPHTIWRLRPGIEVAADERRLWGMKSLRINEHGMRGPSVPIEKPPGTRRVLVVGGSHPMGMYVDDRAMYAAALERRLNAMGGSRWQVLNGAVAGHTTWQGLQFVEHHGLQFDPDVVVFDLGVNDVLPLNGAYATPDHEVTSTPSWALEGARILDRSAAGYLLKRALAPTARPAEGEVRVPPEQGRLNAEALVSLADEHGFRPLFLQQVVLRDLPGEGPGETQCMRTYEEVGPTVPVCALFDELGSNAEAYFVDTMHANEAGHALIADAIADAFQREGWTAP